MDKKRKEVLRAFQEIEEYYGRNENRQKHNKNNYKNFKSVNPSLISSFSSRD
jgi:hypothetical protein